MNELANLLILLTGPLASFLSQRLDYPSRKWASMVAIWGQPAWMWLAFSSHNWGMFIVCCLYTCSWSLGLYNYWIPESWKQQ